MPLHLAAERMQIATPGFVAAEALGAQVLCRVPARRLGGQTALVWLAQIGANLLADR